MTVSVGMWREQVRGVTGRYMSEAAAEAATALVSAFHTAERIAGGDTSEHTRQQAVRMLVDLTFGLALNEWFRQHQGFVMPVFMTAMNAWLDAMEYAAQPDDVSRGKAILARAVVVEVAVAALLADKGAAVGRGLSREMRDELMAIRE